jgi:xanthine dehydrogenase accessory factor
MENLDFIVLQTLKTWRSEGRRALLATVVRTWGSSPRPVGSIMALSETGAVVGSVSGGCIEDDLIRQFSQSRLSADQKGTVAQPIEGPPRRVRYGITADEAHRFGLPCGGTLELLLEFNPDANQLEALVAALEKGQLMQRSTLLTTGAVTLSACDTPAGLSIDALRLVNTFGPQYRMLLIGAGQLTEYLATMAIFNGFSVTVCDPRDEYRTAWSVSGATLINDWPDDVVKAFRPDQRTCVLALTHDPKLDDLALLEALQTDAFYIGAIGSRRNNEQRRERLIEHFEQTEASLARLRGPIGIYIGSKTPAEIAVSVMAEVLAVKNAVPLPRDFNVAVAKQAIDGPSVALADDGVCYVPDRVN